MERINSHGRSHLDSIAAAHSPGPAPTAEDHLIAEIAAPLLSQRTAEGPQGFELKEIEQLKALRMDISFEELLHMRIFASEQAKGLASPKYLSKKEMLGMSPYFSHAITVHPDGNFVIHLGKKGDALFDRDKSGTWKILTRGVQVIERHVQPVAVLQAKLAEAQVDAALKEDRRGTWYHSEYVVQSSAEALVRKKDGKAATKVYLFQSLAAMDVRESLEKNFFIQDKIKVIRDAARGLMAIHNAKDIHRDIKPENLLIDLMPDNKTIRRARVADLAFCTSIAQVQKAWDQGERRVCGTADYIPKEVDKRVRPACAADDVYALGVTYEELLQDEYFDGMEDKDMRLCQSLCRSMRSPNPKQRPSAKIVAQVLDGVLNRMIEEEQTIVDT